MNVDPQVLLNEIHDLRQQLADARQALKALAGGQVDAIVSASQGGPVLLKAAQEALARSEARFRALTENSTDGISITDIEGNIKYITPPAARIFGLTPVDMLGQPFDGFVLEEDRAHTRHERMRLIGSDQVSLIEFRVIRRDGAVRWIESCAKQRFADPDIQGIVENFRDITERKVAQEEREGFFQLSLDLLCIANMDGHLSRLNPAWESTLGWTAEELCGRPWIDFVHPEDRAATQAVHTGLAEGQSARRFQNRYLCKDGTYKVLQWSSIPSLDGSLIYACAHDLTDRLRAEEELRNSEARYRQIVDTAAEGIWIYDDRGVVRFMNPSMARMLGCTVAEGTGRTISDFLPPRLPEASADWLERLKRGANERTTVQLKRADGSLFWASMQSAPLSDDNDTGKRALALVTDITDLKNSEEALRRSDEQLRLAQKMEAVGSLAGGIAHDFNNLLSVILSFSGGILDDLGPTDPLRADLKEIEWAGRRAAELTRQLLLFSRKEIGQPVVIDINPVAEDLQRIWGRTLGEHIRVELELASQPAKVFADRGQIEQVLMNLAVNARDAMRAGGTLKVKTSIVDIDAAHTPHLASMAPGTYVVIAVTDTGEGIPLDVQPRIFEPFFTTKGVGEGTGLGLSTVYGIVQQSGGHVDFSTEPGRGTAFFIYLPYTNRPSQLAEREPSSVILMGTETILLVEDEESVRRALCSILRKAGYEVIEARSASAAIPLFEQHEDRIHLLLTDVVMPKISGPELAERLSKIRPDLKVLFVSGYTENTIAHHGILDAGIHFLQKPILPADLLRKLRQVLDLPKA